MTTDVLPGNKPKAYLDMSLSELVIIHNQMANSPVGQSCGLKPVQSFRDKATAVRRCTSVEVQIRAAVESDRHERKEPKAKEAPQPKPKTEWGVRTGTNREKLIAAMLKEPPKTLAQLADAVYGDASKTGAISMVLKGVIVTIKKGELPYEVVKAKSEGGTTYSLKGV